MSKTRNLSDLLDANGDVKSTALDNVALTGIDDNATSTAVTIDSSGHVLVATTDNIPWNNNSGSSADAGIALRTEGKVAAAGYNTEIMILNRTGTDGTIAQFRKDGTEIGSIGTRFGYTRIGVSNTNLIFDGGNDRIAPSDSNLNAQDNTTTLGWSDRRFKDLYLGGNIYLGGTGSANALDDYEEGTFDVTVSGSTSGSSTYSARGQYTKVGRLCIATYSLEPVTFPTFTGNLQFGLPFTASSGPVEFRGPDIYFFPNGYWDGVSNFGGVNPKVNSGQGVLLFNVKVVDGDRQTTLSSSNSTLSGRSTYARFSITYATQ